MVSVIIPAYNAESYIEKAVNSVCGQSYDDIEVIVVNDGSNDSTPKVIDRLKNSDDRIKVYHKPNGGVSSARNYGLEKAEGQYVIFLDADDQLADDAIRIMVDVANGNNADIVCGLMSKGNTWKYSEIGRAHV